MVGCWDRDSGEPCGDETLLCLCVVNSSLNETFMSSRFLAGITSLCLLTGDYFMRLTEAVLLRSPQITNPLGERELDLRGNGLTLLDEAPLAQLNDSFDVIDLTDNNLTAIEYVPEMKRLTTLIAHRNRLQRVSLSSVLRVPNLHTFVADDNAFTSLDQLVVFGKLKHLERISLGGSNRVSQHEHYRQFLIYLCPKLKLINFQRVLQTERVATVALSATFEKLVRQASGAAAMNMTLSLDTKVRKRGRHADAAQPSSDRGQASVGNSKSDGAGEGDGVISEDAINAKISELQTKIDDAQTEEEIAALMEEMEALTEALDKKRARKR